MTRDSSFLDSSYDEFEDQLVYLHFDWRVARNFSNVRGRSSYHLGDILLSN